MLVKIPTYNFIHTFQTYYLFYQSAESFSPTYRFFANILFSPTSFTNIRTAVQDVSVSMIYQPNKSTASFGNSFSKVNPDHYLCTVDGEYYKRPVVDYQIGKVLAKSRIY